MCISYLFFYKKNLTTTIPFFLKTQHTHKHANPPITNTHTHTQTQTHISLQVDELGFREGIPLRGQKRHDYLQFTAEAFRCAFAFLACVLVVWGRKTGFISSSRLSHTKIRTFY